MAELHLVKVGWYSTGANGLALIMAPGEEEPKASIRIRGGQYPTCGDGPWFCAVKYPESLETSDGEFRIGTYRSTVPNVLTVGQHAFGRACLAAGIYYRESYYVNGANQSEIVGFVTRPNGDLYLNYRTRSHSTGNPQYRIPAGDPNVEPESWVSAAQRFMEQFSDPWTERSILVRRANGVWNSGAVLVIRDYTPPVFNFKNAELDTFNWMAEFGIMVNGGASKWASAFNEAVDSLDLSDVNGLANIVEAAGALVSLAKTIRDIFKGDFGKVLNDLKHASDPRNLWLSYRYVYKTTQLDVEAYRETLQRLGDLATAGNYLRSDGRFQDDTGSYGCRIKVETNEIIPSDIVSFLAAVGIEPNAQNLWDMIPYSFVVDWFLHVSDLLELVDSWGNAISMPYAECWLTYKSEYDNQTVTYRVPGRRPDIPPVYVTKEASSKTVNMRVADSIALFT